MVFIQVNCPEGPVTNGARTDFKSRPFDIVSTINISGVTNGVGTDFELRLLDVVPRINFSGVTEYI